MRTLHPIWMAAAVAGCTVGGLELENRDCPCVEGYVCNPQTNKCVAGNAVPLGDPDASVQPMNLRMEWSTSNAIRWTWDTSIADKGDELARYELLLTHPDGKTELFTGDPGLATSPQTVNPELSLHAIPAGSGDENVVGTITDLLVPDSEYSARLTAVDSSDRRWSTETTLGSTIANLANEIVLFTEMDVGDTSAPADFVYTMGDAHEGSFLYQWTNSGCVGQCDELLRRDGLDVDTGSLGADDFETSAFVEIAIATNGDTPSYFTRVVVACDGGAATNAIDPLGVRPDDAYRVWQLPLRAFDAGTQKSSLDTFATPCTAFGVSGVWNADAVVRIDSVRIRY
jgi:hypothetical protein